MRWFKHLTASHDDEKLAFLLETEGPRGYGTYWLILEIIAGAMDGENSKHSVSYPVKKWSSMCNLRPSSFRLLAERLTELGLISTESNDKVVRISCPNLVKYRDEYSNRKASRKSSKSDVSGHTPDKVAARTDTDTEVEQTQNTPDSEDPSVEDEGSQDSKPSTAAHAAKLRAAFDSCFWPNYPKKRDKAAAFRSFRKLFPQRQDQETKSRRWGNLALHLAALQAEFSGRPKEELQFCKNASTWLNAVDFDEAPESDVVPNAGQTWEVVDDE